MKSKFIIIFFISLSKLTLAQDTLTLKVTFVKNNLLYKKTDSTLVSGLVLQKYDEWLSLDKIWHKQYYLNGKKNGLYEIFTTKGKLIEKGNFKENLKDGKYYYYYDNEAIHHIEYYILGVLEKVEYFDVKGKKIEK